MIRFAMVALVAGVVAAGCGGGGSSNADGGVDAALPPDAATPDAPVADSAVPDAAVPDAYWADSQWFADAAMPDPNGTSYQYVFDDILMPASAAQSAQYGINLDGDPQGRPDNALGQIMSVLAGQASVDAQPTIDSQVNRGDVIHLANLQTTSLTTAANVGMAIYIGTNPSTAPCAGPNDTVCRLHLDGSTTFDVDPSSGADPTLVGQLVGGTLTAGAGRVTIALPLFPGGSPVLLDLRGARVQATVNAAGLMQGKLGGALSEADVNQSVLPALHANIVAAIAADCSGTAPPCCTQGSTGETFVDLFDEDSPQDCQVTLQELQNNSLISSLLAPDVDLFVGDPANGIFAPRVDGVKDCLSLGIGFTGTTATFTQP